MKTMIILFLLFESIFSAESMPKFHRCGYGDSEFNPKLLTTVVESKEKDPAYSRKLEELDADGFKPLNIYFDFENLKVQSKQYNISDDYMIMITNAVNKAIETLKKILSVKLSENLSLTPDKIKAMGIDNFNTTFPIFTDPPTAGMNDLGYDLIVFGKFNNSLADDIFASSELRYIAKDGRIIVGLIGINSKIDLSIRHSERYLTTIMLHELTHLLGFEVHYIKSKGYFKQENDETGKLHSLVTSPKVLAVARKYFNCSTIKGIQMENWGPDINRYSHWDSRYLLGDYMNLVLYTEEEVISEFTLALLEDLGYYKAKYYTGGLMRFGKGRGCDFIYEDCVNKTTHKTKFKNEFFDTIRTVDDFELLDQDLFNSEAACSSGRQSKLYHKFLYGTGLQSRFYYFGDDSTIGYYYSDFCTVGKGSEKELAMDYYVGHCSSLGSDGDWGYSVFSKIESYKTIDGREYFVKSFFCNSSADMVSYTGETYSDHSFCYQGPHYSNWVTYIRDFAMRAVCHESFCSSRTLTIKILDKYYACPRRGGKMYPQTRNWVFCPDYYLICSGTVMCNDMYDCIDKKSETREESYYLDYEPFITQQWSDVYQL